MTITEMLTEAQPVAARIARKVAQDFRGYIEQEDLHQEMVAWVLGNDEVVEVWLTPTDEDEKCEIGRRKLYTAMRREARRVAHEAKAERLGYSVDDLHFYSRATLEELLPFIYDYEAWLPDQVVSDGPRSNTDAAVASNNKVALLCDVKQAYEQANDEDRTLLYDRFIDPVDPEVMAVEAGVTRQTIQRRTDRALGRMVERLGGSRPSFGGQRRQALSNAQAQQITHSQMEG